MFHSPCSHPVSRAFCAVYPRRVCWRIKGLADENGELQKTAKTVKTMENGHERHDQAA
ncbi:MAG TPA: hypothetical protein VLA02_00390 [Reyranella sp.]|nr:hypothetical protein [Reyranella sp.]